MFMDQLLGELCHDVQAAGFVDACPIKKVDEQAWPCGARSENRETAHSCQQVTLCLCLLTLLPPAHGARTTRCTSSLDT